MVAYGLIALIGAMLAIGLWRYVTRNDRRHRRYLADQARWRRAPAATAPASHPSDEDR